MNLKYAKTRLELKATFTLEHGLTEEGEESQDYFDQRENIIEKLRALGANVEILAQHPLDSPAKG